MHAHVIVQNIKTAIASNTNWCRYATSVVNIGCNKMISLEYGIVRLVGVSYVKDCIYK